MHILLKVEIEQKSFFFNFSLNALFILQGFKIVSIILEGSDLWPFRIYEKV